MFLLETGVGQFSGLSPTDAYEKMAPIFQGLGFAAIAINGFIGFYYNVIIAYCIYYFFASIRSELLWSECGAELDCFKRKNLTGDCEVETFPFTSKNSNIFKIFKKFRI